MSGVSNGRRRGTPKSVRGWSGPGGGRVAARDVDDMRDATWGGVRRPIRNPRRVVAGWPIGAQIAAALTVIAGSIAVLGVIAFALLPQSVVVAEGGLDRLTCTTLPNGEVRSTGRISSLGVDDYIDIDDVGTFTIDVDVFDTTGLIGEGSETVDRPNEAWTGHLSWTVDVVVDGRDGAPRCEVTLTANR